MEYWLNNNSGFIFFMLYCSLIVSTYTYFWQYNYQPIYICNYGNPQFILSTFFNSYKLYNIGMSNINTIYQVSCGMYPLYSLANSTYYITIVLLNILYLYNLIHKTKFYSTNCNVPIKKVSLQQSKHLLYAGATMSVTILNGMNDLR